MKRIVLYLVVLGVILFIVKAIAPLVLLGVVGLVLLAWKRPETVTRLTDRAQLARVPSWMRATPMRFAGSIAFIGFVMVGVTAPMGAANSHPDPSPTQAPVAVVRETEEPSPTPTQRPTPAPTARPTARPTASPEPTPVFGEEPTGPTQMGTVISVTDGDTIKVDVDGVVYNVRYIGVSTPEVHGGVEWLGPEASTANAELVAAKRVLLEKDVSETDQFGRLLRHVWVEDGSGWLLVNLELVRLGFATVTSFPPDVKYIDELYVPAQASARTAALGLWAPAPTPVPVAAPIMPVAPQTNCEPSYPGICIAIGSSDLDCPDIAFRRFEVVHNVANPDPHGFDGDRDGIGCES
jgi:micrococcal nuclease